MSQYTPMIQQYLTIKEKHRDAFLFFRLGDFYEMFFEDAKRASQLLEITLTSRDGGSKDRIPMCGVPHHSAPNYIKQLVEMGYKVAICEQVEDPKATKGVVKREVIQIITPGTVMDQTLLKESENNFIAGVAHEGTAFSIVLNDLSTGELRGYLYNGDVDSILQELQALEVREVVVSSQLYDQLAEPLRIRQQVIASIQEEHTVPASFVGSMANSAHPLVTAASGRLFSYLVHTQKRSLEHIQPLAMQKNEEFMKIDSFSKRNLELTETNRLKGKKGSLLWLLDRTVTGMGSRKLKQWMEQPLYIKEHIEERLHVVEELMSEFFIREELRDALKNVYDLERLAGKVSFGSVTARDLVQLKVTLTCMPKIKEIISRLRSAFSERVAQNLDCHESLCEFLDEALHEDPPLSIKEGGLIKVGYHEALDRYRDASVNGKAWIAALEQQERQATGIKSLKIGYNRIFGYFIEVTKSNLHAIPQGRYERKQTLANAERYVTPELKEKERLILEAEEKMVSLEYELFLQLREHVKQYIQSLQQLASQVSAIDVLQGFAVISDEQHYVKPVISERGTVSIVNGRHPVVEKVLDSQEYVPNDFSLHEARSMLLITGPNMAGKSTYMRQLALTVIMMQIGCFVPADEAELPLFDQIFTRIGAADDLVGGQSTFMVEMLETNYALNKATKHSLLLLDEIGRGTSTYDGMALAQAIIEYIHHEIGAKTLFSTHYHELTVLAEMLPSLQNVFVSAVEEEGRLVFLHKVIDGQADRSFGIHVAQLAQLPAVVINRAKDILTVFEANEDRPSAQQETAAALADTQLTLFTEEQSEKKVEIEKPSEVEDMLRSMNVLDMTPLDAMNALYALQKKLK
ncbi:DNA mismatch repair protein MutS [Fictibacillus macauensis ZFHKF-1]|uniref:DNA mismatch repair protein MutS n=1 Tax=Fictibacillus macauensis ZFHKF-1 TaxID=1196324 RepID=I8UJ85_9BACL|nr:DNA mismatch repair protein MutS [Fictibacillus macauensis]EIT86898.1 DNA mismatch repair protein MutS [Fictibacillus macauensis ZFHKF-1]